MKKSIKNMMQLGMDFEWLLDRFLIDFGGQDGSQNRSKIDPRGVQEQDEKGIKKYIKKGHTSRFVELRFWLDLAP